MASKSTYVTPRGITIVVDNRDGERRPVPGHPRHIGTVYSD